jgi:hypothetical protein
MRLFLLVVCAVAVLGTSCFARVDTLIVIDRGKNAWPLFPKTPKENVPFTKLFIIVKHEKTK